MHYAVNSSEFYAQVDQSNLN